MQYLIRKGQAPVFSMLTLAAAMAWVPAQAWAQCTAMGSAPGQTAAQQAAQQAAQLVALSGQGQTRPEERAPWAAAILQQRLPVGSDLRTLALSTAALLLADRTQIRLAEHSLVRLCDSRVEQTRLELPLGRVWARSKGPAVDVQLHTPAAVAAVRGTDWDVEVAANGRTTLTVLSGRIDVTNAQGSVQVGPSEQASVVPGQAPTKRLLVQARERVQWVMAPALVPSRWVQLAQGTEAWQGQAAAALQAGRLADLQLLVQERLRSHPQDVLAQRLLAETEVAAGQLAAAEQRLLATWQLAHDVHAAARRAQLLQALDQTDAARAFIAQARAKAPDAVPLLLADADARRLAGDGPGALALYHQAVAQAQGEAEQAATQAALGRALRERGDLAASRQALARAVQLQPDDVEYQAEAATSAAQALRLPEAQAGFAQALTRTGDDYVALAGEGLVHLHSGQFEEARTQLLKALVIEPRYAQAQVWLALAEYQLGNASAAFDALERARQADANDPMPWQIEATLRNDSGEPVRALAAAREALARLPYLKSLNPLTSDAQGSANLGKALGDFGLEHWARAVAQQSYDPLWAGSHFFLANRVESDFSRNSEMTQGYLSDPLVIGMVERRAGLLPLADQEWLAVASAGRTPRQTSFAADGVWRGMSLSRVPMAWLVRANRLSIEPRSASGSYWVRGPLLDVALGVRPSDRLNLFLVRHQSSDRWAYPGGMDLGDARMDGVLRDATARTDIGGSWRWSADAQTWLKWHHASNRNASLLSWNSGGASDSRMHSTLRGVMLRHVVQSPGQRWSLGWERVQARLDDGIFDTTAPWTSSVFEDVATLDMPWVEGQWVRGAWALSAGAFWPRLAVRNSSRYIHQVTGQDIFPAERTQGGTARKLQPRMGASYRLGPGRALHAAYVHSQYSPATHTLAPVGVGAIPIDYQYQRMGSIARKKALQIDWELDAKTFAWGVLSSQDIRNLVDAEGGFLIPRMGAELTDRGDVLAPVGASGQIMIDAYNGKPNFSQGRLQQAGVALNRVLPPNRSLLASYTWAHSRNTGALYGGKPLPGVPRHTAVLAHVWRHGGHDLTLTSLVYRGTRFDDEAAQTLLGAGWNFNLVLFRESANRRWAWTATLQTPLHGTVRPALWTSVRYRMD